MARRSSPPPPPPPGKVDRTLSECLEHVRKHATRGDAASVVATMDKFAYEHWMMNVGDVKGMIVDQEIATAKPQVMVELGGFCGYSAVRFANKMREVSGPDARYYSFEASPAFAAIATEIVDIAGLSDIITIFVGTFAETYTKLKELGVEYVDVFFIDHDKRHYLNDLQLIESSGLLRLGSVVVADNVITPGAPDYLEYVRSHAHFESVFHDSFLEYCEMRDGVEVSTYIGEQP